MKGKMVKFSSGEKKAWSLALDERDMEVLKDVLEAHLEYLYDTLKDCVMDDDTRSQYEDEQVRISRMLDLIDKEVEDETN